jgi:predicted outer membrane protein
MKLHMQSLVDVIIASVTAVADATDSLPRVKQILRQSIANGEIEDEAARKLIEVIAADYDADFEPASAARAWHQLALSA